MTISNRTETIWHEGREYRRVSWDDGRVHSWSKVTGFIRDNVPETRCLPVSIECRLEREYQRMYQPQGAHAAHDKQQRYSERLDAHARRGI